MTELLIYARLYSTYDRWRKMFVYVGQTSSVDDFHPHGTAIIIAWNNKEYKGRYIYSFEKEWHFGITQGELNIQETKMILRRNTWRRQNQHGMNLVLMGRGGKLSRDTKLRVSEANRTLETIQHRRNLYKRRCDADPDYKARMGLYLLKDLC